MSESYYFMSDIAGADDWMNFWQLDQNCMPPKVDGTFDDHESMLAYAPLDSLSTPSPAGLPTSLEYSGLVAPQVEYSLNSDIAVNGVETQHKELLHSGVPSSAALMHYSAIYLPNTCASCDGFLDKVEQDLKFSHPTFYCNRSQELSHLTLACQNPHCLMKFSDIKDLKNHSVESYHFTLNCGIAGCNAALTASSANIAAHFDKQHPDISHYNCAKCELSFNLISDLSYHCKVTGHAGIVCRFPGCGAECIEVKDLKRHQLIHKVRTTTYPCVHRRTYRGTNGFKRKDHLVQHMRNYHRMEDYAFINGTCRERYCYFQYTTLGGLTEHMLEVHHSLTYVCQEANCDRVGMKGFENDKDLKSHVKNDHISAYQCTQSGCNRVGTNGWKRKRDMVKHIEKFHSVSVDPQNIR